MFRSMISTADVTSAHASRDAKPATPAIAARRRKPTGWEDRHMA
jgi:hypothetical protein